jgi:molybdenum cofactor biosynthesis enzyme MoaA
MKIQTFNILAGNTNCNANCPFCISKMTPKAGMSSERPSVNWINFKKACQFAKINLVNTVMITGKGEPLLYPQQITDFLTQLKPYGFPIIEIQTNALILGRDFSDYRDTLKTWRKKGVSTFVISIVHYKNNRNKEIYAPNSAYFDIEQLINNLHCSGFSVRLNCVLLKGYIDSVKELNNLVDFCLKNKVEQLTLKPVELLKIKNNPVAEATKKFLLPNNSEKNIHKFLNKNAIKLRTLDFGGIVYDYKGQNVCITDCLSGKPLTEDLRQIIFFPDGHLRYDWRYEGAILI